MVKVDEMTASCIYYKGYDVMIVPCKIPLSNLWAVKTANFKRDKMLLDVIIRSHRAFMCNEKNGTECSLFVHRDDFNKVMKPS